jgi:hypothetical protein
MAIVVVVVVVVVVETQGIEWLLSPTAPRCVPFEYVYHWPPSSPLQPSPSFMSFLSCVCVCVSACVFVCVNVFLVPPFYFSFSPFPFPLSPLFFLVLLCFNALLEQRCEYEWRREVAAVANRRMHKRE